jgi:glycosyltransferase involved in cell wall biosynthesis
MRVAYLINQYPKVSHSFIRREILALERLGVTVIRISLRGWDIELIDPEDIGERSKTTFVLRKGIPELIGAVSLILMASPVRFFKALKLAFWMGFRAERALPIHFIYLAEACWIIRLLRSQKADHLHAHFGTNSAEVGMLVNALGGPSWSFTVHGPKEFEKVEAIGLAEKLRRASFVVAISSFGRSQLYRLLPAEHWQKIQVVHCGLDSKFVDLPARKPSCQIPRLVCVGRLCEQKGQALLIEAVSKLIANGRSLEVVLVGDGEMRTQLEKLICDRGLERHIQITGWLTGEQVIDELWRAQAMVLPSFAEGLPVAIMEAMALGRPVISTYVAGIPELVENGKHGWLVPAGDVGALAGAINELLETPSERLGRMGEAARLQVWQHHDVDTECAKLSSLFEVAIRSEKCRHL